MTPPHLSQTLRIPAPPGAASTSQPALSCSNAFGAVSTVAGDSSHPAWICGEHGGTSGIPCLPQGSDVAVLSMHVSFCSLGQVGGQV